MPATPSHSALESAGLESAEVAALFYWMAGGAAVIWLIVIGLAIYALVSRKPHPPQTTRVLVIGGGALLPTVVLAALLTSGLSLMPHLHRTAPEGSVVIRVSGVRWWWRVEYLQEDGSWIETANELHLPVDQPVEFRLVSEDVIHAFWIPAIGGKMDMIPGRENRLTLQPTREGHFAGVCAEYCGTAHAQMKFRVVVTDAASFERWQQDLARSAAAPRGRAASTGKQVFFTRGCSACHTIRGTAADGRVGPDLTHFGGRRSIGAGLLPNTAANLRRWITQTHQVKPGVEMPAYRALAGEAPQHAQPTRAAGGERGSDEAAEAPADNELDQLVAYLESLK